MDQLTHLLRHVATQGGDVTPFRYGHVSSYDPTQHRVRAIIPSLTDQDGQPLLSPWMPVGTLSSGNGFGIQTIFAGGASVDNPTNGEQVLVGIFDRQRGVSCVPCVFYSGTAKPPATNLPTKADGYGSDAATCLPGDVIISSPSAQEGGPNNFVRLRQSGVIEIWCAGQLNADVIGDVNVTSETGSAVVNVAKGNATVQAPNGTVNIVGTAVRLSKALADNLLQLCNSAFWTNFNTHTHANGSPPDQQATQAMLTQTVTAE